MTKLAKSPLGGEVGVVVLLASLALKVKPPKDVGDVTAGDVVDVPKIDVVATGLIN